MGRLGSGTERALHRIERGECQRLSQPTRISGQTKHCFLCIRKKPLGESRDQQGSPIRFHTIANYQTTARIDLLSVIEAQRLFAYVDSDPPLATRAGDITALAWMYFQGVGVEKNDCESFRLFKFLLDSGYETYGENGLWRFYRDGLCVPADPEKAERYARRALAPQAAGEANQVQGESEQQREHMAVSFCKAARLDRSYVLCRVTRRARQRRAMRSSASAAATIGMP